MNLEGQEGGPRQEAMRQEAQRQLTEKLERFDIRPDPNHKDQHFLINPETVSDLIEAANVTEADTVTEIGAGPGTITTELAKRAERVIAVEIDKRFEPLLRELQTEYPNIDQTNIILSNKINKNDFLGVKVHGITHKIKVATTFSEVARGELLC